MDDVNFRGLDKCNSRNYNMAFAFRFKNSSQPKKTTDYNASNRNKELDGSDIKPRLSSSELNKLTKTYPSWLRDNSSIKNLPGIYQGVLGQVQIQPKISENNEHLTDIKQLAKRHQDVDYMTRFTDTERVCKLLLTSRLSNEILAVIWAYVNKTFPGKLTNREVCLALALVAIFQRPDTSHSLLEDANRADLCKIMNREKKPPIPKLHPIDTRCDDPSNKHLTRIVSGQSCLLIDLADDSLPSSNRNNLSKHSKSTINPIDDKGLVQNHQDRDDLDFLDSEIVAYIVSNNDKNLIDMDGDRFVENFRCLSRVWLKFLNAIRFIFKRSFDILNVNHSRMSAIEALKSPKGQLFSRQLCVCYPLAHNIKCKIDELDIFARNSSAKGSSVDYSCGLFNKKYLKISNDLITSINEYWAVLINLLHESGQTNFIESIMDRLNRGDKTVQSESMDQLALELDGLDKADVCSICHTKFYLISSHDTDKKQILENVSLDIDATELLETNELISNDGSYFYHAKCANLWINNVDINLPFRRQSLVDILNPTKD